MEALDSLWVPDDNSTLSPLPTGLQRYTGEQDFFLVVAHVTTSTITSSSVPYPWGAPGSTSAPLTVAQTPSSQMVNFLVPRSQFLSSVMGQAILNNSPLSTAGTLDAISNLPIPQLACYWQNNAVVPNGQTPPLCHAAGVTSASGTSPTNPYFVSVVADQENCANDLTTSVNCQAGGVPSEPALSTLSPGNAAPALQAVITLNLSSPTDLDRLLSGLLDNTTVMSNGKLGVNGYLKDVTGALPTLGLNGVVMKALVNASWASAGFYGAPPSYAPPPPPPPPSCSGLGCVWNAVSGAVVSFAAGVITAVATVVWDAVTAAAAYVDEVVKGLANAVAQGAQWVAATAVNTLKAVAHALEAALQALIAFVEKEVTALIDAVVSPIRTAVNNYFSSVNQDFDSMYTAVGNGQPVTTSLAKPFWQDMALPLLLMTAIAVAAETALVIVNGLSLGAGFFVGILVTVIVGTVLTLLAPTSGLISEMLAGGSAAILAMMQFLNDTASSLHKGPLVAHPQSGGLCGYYQSFHTLADAFAVLDDILGSASGIVLSLLLFSINAIVGVKSLTLLASSAILSLTILAFFFDAASLLNSGEKALAFADIGFISGLVAIMISKVSPAIEDIPIFGEFDTVIKYMDYAATGMGGAEAIVDTLNYCPGT